MSRRPKSTSEAERLRMSAGAFGLPAAAPVKPDQQGRAAAIEAAKPPLTADQIAARAVGNPLAKP